VGDSITAGYGILGAGPNCSFDATTESEPAAWGALAAATLGAAHTSIAWSGIGVYRNNGGDMTNLMPVQFEKVTPTENTNPWTFDTYTPDVVVVNLGTHHFATGDPGQPYVDAMPAFVAQIRGHYPNAWIVLASSPMLGEPDHTTEDMYLQSVVANGTADAKLAFLDIPTQLDADG